MSKLQAISFLARYSSIWRAVVLSAAAGVLAPAVAQTEPLAKLANGEVISEQDFGAYLARRVDLKPLARNYWGADNALREMAMTRVLVLEGERLKMERKTSSGEQVERFDDAYGHAVYRSMVKSCTKPADEKEAKRFYDANPEVFKVPASARVARVILPMTETLDGTRTMGWLMAQAHGIANGEKRFEDVVARAAQVYKLETQGDLGWVQLTGDVPILRALAEAKSGELVGPVREGDFGYLFLLGEKREARQLKWSEVEKQAANRALAYCREQANKELTDKLFKQYGVTFNEAALKALFRVPPPATNASAPQGGASAPNKASK